MPHISEIQIRDPFVLRRGDLYYLYGTTDPDCWKGPGIGFDVYIACNSLTEWDGPFPAFRPPVNFWSEKNFWAPEVYEYQNAFYMFATFLPISGCRGTAVLKAVNPLGPFILWSDGIVTPHDWECLDGTLHWEDGIPYMVFCHEWSQVGDGQVCAVMLSPDLRKPIGEVFTLFTASEAPWTAPLAKRAPGSYVTDGPYLYKAKNEELFMLWSTFGSDGLYRIGAAVSENGRLHGPWRQCKEPLYTDDGGHGMLFDYQGGRLCMAIHTPNKTPNERALFLEVFEENGNLLRKGGAIC